MKPSEKDTRQGEIFERELETLVRPEHRLVKLGKQIDWSRFEREFGVFYTAETGRPGISTRLLSGITILKYLHDLSDEATVEMWVENPYWQYFCGERYFQHQVPFNRSTMSRWRERIGEKGGEVMLEESLAVALKSGALKMTDLGELYADTTVQEKNVAYPSISNMLDKGRQRLVREVQELGIPLRQTYQRRGKLARIKAHRYAAAQQWRRAQRKVKSLSTMLGRVMRDVERKATSNQRVILAELLQLCGKLRLQAQDAKAIAPKDKIYSLHEPLTEAIAKGKIHKRFEFGVKASFVTTRRSGLVLSAVAMHGAPYDGHTLKAALAKASQHLGAPFKSHTHVGVDLGYRGHGIVERFRVVHPKLKKLSPATRKFIRARSKIEATISYMKRCCRLGRNYLRGKLGDIMNILFAATANNFAVTLRHAG